MKALLAAAAAVAAAPVPTPIGVGPLFHPNASGRLVDRGLPVRSLVCAARDVPRFGVHLEVFAHGRVVIVPAGIGIAPPRRTGGPYVLSGRCSYPVRTREPSGVVEVARSVRLTLGHVFAVWGQPLGPRRLAGFSAQAGKWVRVYLNGRRLDVDPRSLPLRPHDEIVLELGRSIPPHVSYRFEKGL